MNDQLFKKRQISNRSLARRVGWKKPKVRVLVVTEGEKTEVFYLRKLLPTLGLGDSIVVEVDGNCDSAPINIVDHGISRVLREGKPEDGGFSAVFFVFDRDNHTTYFNAIDKINAFNNKKNFLAECIGIKSIPCFEFWFILHFEMTRAPYEDTEKKTGAEKVVDHLRRIPQMSAYNKCLDDACIAELIGRTWEAYSRSLLCMDDVAKVGEENPSTEVHVLIDGIKKLAGGKKVLES